MKQRDGNWKLSDRVQPKTSGKLPRSKLIHLRGLTVEQAAMKLGTTTRRAKRILEKAQ